MTTSTDPRREISITRVFRAPRALVLEMWSRPELITRWWGPYGFSTTTHDMEFQPGGTWRFTMHGPDGTDFPNFVRYVQTGPDCIEYAHGGENELVDFHVWVTFSAVDEDKTEMHFRMQFPTEEEKERVANEYGAAQGLVQTVSRLETELISSQEGQFIISRSFAAPVQQVWDVWSTAEHLKRWWGPTGCQLDVLRLDFVPGGLFHYAMKTPDGHTMWGRFIYRDVSEPHRLVFVVSFSNEAAEITRAPFAEDWPLEVLNVVTFHEEDGKTTATLHGGPLAGTRAELEKFMSFFESMQKGFGGTFDQLDKYLAETGDAGVTARWSSTS